ncbi:MAG: SMI1/KNR4 family protein [Minicystis sp.]
MDWREWIVKSYREEGRTVTPGFRDGVTPERLLALEAELEVPIPTPLRELLQQTDGMTEMDEGKPFLRAIWSCDEIAKQNRSFRTGQLVPPDPPDPPGAPGTRPVFFGWPGVDGILFAFLVRPAGPEDPAVYAYYPIEGEWRLISPSLQEHMRGWTV